MSEIKTLRVSVDVDYEADDITDEGLDRLVDNVTTAVNKVFDQERETIVKDTGSRIVRWATEVFLDVDSADEEAETEWVADDEDLDD